MPYDAFGRTLRSAAFLGIRDVGDFIMTNDDASGLVAGAVQFLPLLIIFMIFYFFIIRKRQPKHKPWTAILTSGSRPGQVTRLLCASAFLGSFLGRITFRYKMLRFFQNKTRA